jgi:phage shock protein C
METSTDAPAPTTSTGPRFTLRRSRTDRMLSGVCGGVAEALKIDVNLVRLGLVALTVLGAGSGALLYIAAWVLIPEGE